MRVKRGLEFHLVVLVLLNLVLLSFQNKADLWVRGFSTVLSPPVIMVHRVFESLSGLRDRLDALRLAERENRELRNRLFWTRLENDRLRLETLYLREFRRMAEGFDPSAEGGLRVAIVRRRTASYF
jgi:cell shape-determining protein MreC